MAKSERRTPTRWAVWCTIGSYAALLVLTAAGGSIPLDGATWALTLVVGAYVGVDELSTYVASRNLPRGQKYTGSYTKLRNMVIAMFALTFLAVTIDAGLFENIVTSEELESGQVPLRRWTAGARVPVDRLFVALGIVVALFAGGNKAANVAEQAEPSPPAAGVEASTPDGDELDQR
ncbi:MAG: hypothetical protein MI724_16590 [Spirochaetales bacterium]|nr:hypothetical protein [Spirochaetales bacterium]